ncbi:poly(ethylene terephthalate) hydrolase family protein [Sorangium sp. So ce341]|uniref:poly(ethylene terephthalate) hydrolase family protein n=1 Tax=Sorangium sp. So ce341 TaxID=3133302 RepID=UPI003F5F8494
MRRWLLALGVCVSTAACGNGSNGDAAASGGAVGTDSGGTGSGGTASGGATGSGGTAESGGASSGGASSGGAGGSGSGGSSGATGGAASGGQSGSGGQGNAGSGGTTGSGGSVSGCVGDPFPTADPTKTGPFSVTADKNVGPLAGVVPDPIYGDEQQRFNVYRPSNIATSGHCHPILIWANGYRDNPEQKPPKCVVNAGSNQWCGQYGPIVNHLASHGFVVVASLSTATAEGDPLPTTAGLDWILEQAEDASSPYYRALDTTKIGQLGHSYGGMSTCKTASDPRFSALGTICGTSALEGVHTPMLFFCGGKDSTVQCSRVHDVFKTVTDQPAFFLNELNADHGSWVYQGANGVSLSSAAAWFRVHLMDDTANRNFFYGDNCKFCTDGRVQAEQNALMKVP